MSYKISLLPLAALFISASGHAAAGVSISGKGAAWVSPVMGVFAAAKPEIYGLGSRSLNELSNPAGHRKIDLAADSRPLDLLAAHLEAAGVTPSALEAMAMPEKLAALKRAASSAEAAAQRQTEQVLKAAGGEIVLDNGYELNRMLVEAEGNLAYLDVVQVVHLRWTREKLAKSIHGRWQRIMARWSSELPAMTWDGTLNAETLFLKTQNLWIVADEATLPTRRPMPQIYRQRIEDMKRFPQGPWTVQETDLLSQALARPDVAAAFPDAESVESARAELRRAAESARAAMRGDFTLAKAAKALQDEASERFPVRAVRQVERRYQGLLDSEPPTPIRARIAAWIENGGAGWHGLPPLKRLRALAEQKHRALTRVRIFRDIIFPGISAISLTRVVLLAALAVLVLSSYGHEVLVAGAIMFAAVIVAVINNAIGGGRTARKLKGAINGLKRVDDAASAPYRR